MHTNLTPKCENTNWLRIFLLRKGTWVWYAMHADFWNILTPHPPSLLAICCHYDTWGTNFFYDLGLRIGTEVGFCKGTGSYNSVIPKFLGYIRGGQRWVGLGSQRAKWHLFLPSARKARRYHFFLLPLLLGTFYFFCMILRLLPMPTAIPEYHILFWYSWTLLTKLLKQLVIEIKILSFKSTFQKI